MDESTLALEQFRQQWKEEVNARSKKAGQSSNQIDQSIRPRRTSEVRLELPINKPPSRHPIADIKDDSDHDSDYQSSQTVQKLEGLKIKEVDDDEFSATSIIEPKSALEHYEKAVEKENQGNLGDSISHYRKAYRLDSKVDQTYKNKHFPIKPKSNKLTPTPTIEETKEQLEYSTPGELILSYSNLQILGAKPIIEGDILPPCPISILPSEVMYELLQNIAIKDPALTARVSLVCKKLAYNVYTENSIWKRVALGQEFGLASQHYTFQTDLQGRELIYQTLEDEEPKLKLSFPQDTNWREIFRSHPRIRFSGIYISTVNYTRPGGASATQSTWSNPIHIVTYYRYLRFFRDGTCISLLTTNEPIDVVHILTPENVTLSRSHRKDGKDGPSPLPPSSHNIVKHALRGRWRLCHPSIDSQPTSNSAPENAPTLAPGDIHIETEGAGPRYMYTLHLTLKSSSRSSYSTKNNKLQWKGFWGYNTLTSDWGEFHLRNDKPFYFSRVKSYGLGY